MTRNMASVGMDMPSFPLKEQKRILEMAMDATLSAAITRLSKSQSEHQT